MTGVKTRMAPGGGEEMKYLLLFVPCVLALSAPYYNVMSPDLFGIPFFYWAQLLLVPASAICIYAADRLGKA